MNKTQKPAFLFNLEHQSLEIFAFGVVDIDGVIFRLVELMQDAHETPCLGCCGEDGQSELVFVDSLGAAEGKEYAAWRYLLHGLGIEARVALEGIVEGVAVLGEGWGVEDDEIVRGLRADV